MTYRTHVNFFRPFTCAVVLAASILSAGSPVQAAQTWKPVEAGGQISLSSGTLEVRFLSERSVRVRYAPVDVAPSSQDFAYVPRATSVKVKSREADGILYLASTALEVRAELKTGRLGFYDAAGHLVLHEASGSRRVTLANSTEKVPAMVEQTFECASGESLYGLGQGQNGTWDWSGLPMELRQHNTQVAIPFVVSTQGYGLLWNNAALAWFNPIDQVVPMILKGSGTLANELPAATENLQAAKPKPKPPGRAERSGTFRTGDAGEYIFFVANGDRRDEITISVDGKEIGHIRNMWVPYTFFGTATLPANTDVPVYVKGGGADALLMATRRDKTRTVFRSNAGSTIDYTLFFGPELDTVISEYRDATGQAPMWPKWAYGFWQCRERYASQDELVTTAREFRERQIPMDLIVQDWQYWGKYGWGAYQWDEAHYPDPPKLISDLHALNTRFMISIWPNPSGKAKGALQGIHGLIGATSVYDATNPEARNLRWEFVRDGFFNAGTDAWWQDAAEPLDDGNSLANQTLFAGPGNEVRNAYPLFHSQCVYEGQRGTSEEKRVVNLTRSAYTGQQRYGAGVWSGDVSGNWESFQRQISAGLNFCLTGQPYWTTDSGGFFRPRNQYTDPGFNELQSRWFEWSTFSPIQRIHGYQTKTEVWQWLPETQDLLTRYIRLRYRMLPYIYSCAWQVTSAGSTIMRALPMDFRADERTHAIWDEYMFGPSLLVAPVTQLNATGRSVYLPKGSDWIDFWTGAAHPGGTDLKVEAPVGKIPLFVRAGSIIPFGPALQYATEKPADPIELRVYAGSNGKFLLYEDEGDSYRYEKGAYATIPFEFDDKSGVLSIGARHGAFPGMLEKRSFRIVRVSTRAGLGETFEEPAATVVAYDGKPLKVALR